MNELNVCDWLLSSHEGCVIADLQPVKLAVVMLVIDHPTEFNMADIN